MGATGASSRSIVVLYVVRVFASLVNLAPESGQHLRLLRVSGWHLVFQVAVVSIASETGLSFYPLACLHATPSVMKYKSV